MLLLAALLFANTAVSPIQEIDLNEEDTQVVILDEEAVLESQEIIFDDEIASSSESESLLEDEEVLAN